MSVNYFLRTNKDKFILVDEDIYYKNEHDFWQTDNNGYAIKNFSGGIKRLHQTILDPADGFVVDHINRIKLDCRRSNLRHITKAMNALNSPPRKGKYKGVYKHTQMNKYCAQFRHKHIGLFNTEHDAAKAYDMACLDSGLVEFCYLNFGASNIEEILPVEGDVISNPFKGESIFKGVTRSGNKWLARRTVNGVREYLGSFCSQEDAYVAICNP